MKKTRNEQWEVSLPDLNLEAASLLQKHFLVMCRIVQVVMFPFMFLNYNWNASWTH